MDYQLNIYPSSEKEMLNVRAENATKQIKVIQENKLQMLYKKTFGPAVKKYNERAISGRLIDNYYKSIVDSNIPEVYKLVLVIRYELLNKEEIALIQKAFADFKKVLEKEKNLVLVSSYTMSYDEYKELQIFFYPVASDYATGLSVRNDLIDLVRKERGIKEVINILQAMPMFEEKIEQLFTPVNNGQFISQEELEAQAKHVVEHAPEEIHAIAVETLKAQMNALQKINAENQNLEIIIEKEKQRIEESIVWSKETEQKIYEAEEARIAEEARLAEEARKAEEARRIAEAQRREEERLMEEERKLEAARLAEQARRNIELRRQMALQEEEEQKRRMSRNHVSPLSFGNMVEAHLQWQETYNITSDVDYEKIPDNAMKDPRRIALHHADIYNIVFDRSISLVGASFDDCEFSNCKVDGDFTACSIENCVFMSCDISDVKIERCAINGINVDMGVLSNITVDDSALMKVSAKGASIEEMSTSPATSFIKCDFSDATLKGCDMKKNAFMNCNFTNTNFVTCDMRDSAFQICKVEYMNREGSLFRGAQFNQN